MPPSRHVPLIRNLKFSAGKPSHFQDNFMPKDLFNFKLAFWRATSSSTIFLLILNLKFYAEKHSQFQDRILAYLLLGLYVLLASLCSLKFYTERPYHFQYRFLACRLLEHHVFLIENLKFYAERPFHFQDRVLTYHILLILDLKLLSVILIGIEDIRANTFLSQLVCDVSLPQTLCSPDRISGFAT
ncbi:hypothetical protein QLX08_003283 [Tetragonisca angustula]|uniref:Uncharacterized protein n=1 Tax=Tetragonisca angustula TaxID=166442 RepID=A0AAW1A803_9HYME